MSAFQPLCSIVASQFGVQPGVLRETTVIGALPGAERPGRRTALIVMLEDWFVVRLSDLTLCDAMTLGDLAEIIDERAGHAGIQAAE